MENDFNLELITHYFDSDNTSRELLERLRWPNGPECPHCGYIKAYRLKARPTSRKPVRNGVLKCRSCGKQFTVTVGTIMENSHIPLHKWLKAIYLLYSSKKTMSIRQLHRVLGITYRSALFLVNRIRYDRSQPPLINMVQSTMETDRSFIRVKYEDNYGYGPESEGTEVQGDIGYVASQTT